MAQARFKERLDVTIYGGHRPEEEAVLRWLAEHNGIADRVRFGGEYQQADRIHVLAEGHVAAITPRWEDNSPQTVIESLGAGLPVISTAAGGIPEFVEQDVNGILAREGDTAGLAGALDRMVSEPSLVTRLCAGITPSRTIEQHEAAVENVYKAARRPSA